MFSRKSASTLTFAALTLIVLIITSKRLGSWSAFDSPYQPVGTVPGYGHGPHGSGEAPGTAPPENATDDSVPARPVNHDFPPRPNRDPLCDSFPDTSGILLVMKTGASEVFSRLPTQLMTVLKCLPDFLVFSDLDQHVAGYHVHDSLETVLDSVRDGNSDFDLYRRQRWCDVDQGNCNKLGDPSSEGWNLDKYKNVHIAEKTYEMKPGYDWYLFVDADTYVLWPNLMQWLGGLKANKNLYLGSVAMVSNFPFGHGGSGYLLSKASMENFAGKNPGVGNDYDARARNECCGDYVFALAMKEKAKIEVQNVWPTINGEKPSTMPFGPSHWCHPIVTMHHLDSEEISTFWEFERKRYASQNLPSTPPALRIKDIYYEYLHPKLQKTREDWDNGADDRFYLDRDDKRWDWQKDRVWDTDKYTDLQKKAHGSFEDCRAACESLPFEECFMYQYTDGLCSTSRSFQLGKPVKKEDDKKKRIMSGWDVDKIKKWISDQGECSKVRWPDVRY
ncbi:hypothetical protein GQ53DRAFT_660915 [Thozetella sp. PMI_491]|nr:hypothetical protein GQ53DRAFT_660915 [Thozetella sp. PMI_491]